MQASQQNWQINVLNQFSWKLVCDQQRKLNAFWLPVETEFIQRTNSIWHQDCVACHLWSRCTVSKWCSSSQLPKSSVHVRLRDSHRVLTGGLCKEPKNKPKGTKKKKKEIYLGSASEYEQCMTTLKSKSKSRQAKVVHCSGKEQTKAASVRLQGRLMSPCNLTVLCTLRLPADTHAPRISQHSQMKTSRSRGSRSAVYLCLRVVRLRSSFCLLLWILLKDQGKIDIEWCVTWCRNRGGTICVCES